MLMIIDARTKKMENQYTEKIHMREFTNTNLPQSDDQPIF